MPQGNQMDIKTLSLSVAAVAANSRKSFFSQETLLYVSLWLFICRIVNFSQIQCMCS